MDDTTDTTPEPVASTPTRKKRRLKPRVKASLVLGPQVEPAKERGPWLSVPGWNRFCHYGTRRKAPWVKIEVAWLADYRFLRLADHQKLAILSLWVLAGTMDNHLPADAEMLQWKLGLSTPLDLRGLVEAGFLELHGARLEALLGVKPVPAARETPERLIARHILSGGQPSQPPPADERPLVWPHDTEEADDLLEKWERSQPI